MYIDSPNISGSLNITGSLLLNGTAVTASGGGGGSGAGFPFSGSAVITGSLYVSGGNLSGSFAGDGAGLTGLTINQFATVNDTFTNVPSHSVVHNFGTKDVFVQVFESDDTLLIPQTVTTTNTNQVDIVFGDVLSGRVVIGRAGHILQDTGNFVSSSTTVATFSNAMSASISHNFDSLNIITQVYDSNNNVIVPSNIKNTNSNQTLITFSTPRSGKAVIAKAGHIVSGTAAVSASLATTAERVRAGSSGSRDTTTPQSGSLWYNTNTGNLEVYNGASGSGWSSVGVSSSGASGPYTVDYLVVAGGGGGGSGDGGGGGAGGLRTSYGSTSGGGAAAENSMTVTDGAVYTITVGGGSTGAATSSATRSGPGTASSIAGSGITTITSSGGGSGGTGGTPIDGGDGGSGGGAENGAGASGGSGTTGQGYAGGGTASDDASGGGGAAEAGGVGTGTGGGTGGDGLAVNILSTSNATTSNVGQVDGGNVYFAGGGGGGGEGSAAGGKGGGGTGIYASTTENGDANTGGGAAGGDSSYAGGAGGSGVVILRIATSNYSGTYTGSSVDVYTESTDTILVFKTSGTYTA